MEQITSRENPRIKRVLQLINDKAARDESGLFAAEGVKLCIDALMSGIVIREVFVTAKALEKHPELDRLMEKSMDSRLVSDSVAQKLSDAKTSQGVFAVCEKRPEQRPEINSPNARYLLLSSLQDPGNIGTIIRTAEALAIDGVAMSADCPDIYGPKVIRSSMGGMFRLKIWTVPDMRAELERLRGDGVKVYAAAISDTAVKLGAAGFDGACAVLLGNEGAGLPGELVDGCDSVLTIPMAGRADSLGVAAAAGIIAWEMTK